MDFFEAFPVDMGVDLGGGDVGVSQEFLDDAEIGPAFKEVGGKGVAEGMRGDFSGVQSALKGVFFNHSPGIDAVHGPAPGGQKQV